MAVQMDFIGRDALIAGMNAWVLAKEKPLGEILVAQNVLAPARRGLLEELVCEHLKQHHGDPAQSLAVVSSVGSVREGLEILDAEDSFATRLQSAGVPATSGGRFRILRSHAEGGLGKVSVARDGELGREVALKEIKERLADDPPSPRDSFWRRKSPADWSIRASCRFTVLASMPTAARIMPCASSAATASKKRPTTTTK